MTDNIPNIHVGIVGGTRSGKTLYLSCLRRFIDDNCEGITFGGADKKSIDWLRERANELYRGDLPEATLGQNDLRFNLRDSGNRLIEIKILDRAGAAYQKNPNLELIENLSACNGFLVLVDPLERLDDQSFFFRDLFDMLANHIQQNNIPYIKKHFSICLTKIDDPKFLNWFKENNKDFSEIRHEERAKVIFDSWFKAQGNKEDFTQSLRISFGKDNFRYYLISSIGFFSPDGTNYDTNLTETLDEEGKTKVRIRNGKFYSPFNLYAPLYWAMGGKL